MLVTPRLRALSRADPGNSLSSQSSRNSQILVPWVTLPWRSKVKSDEGRPLIASCGLCMGTGGCSQLLTHVHAPHICTHPKEKENRPTQNAAARKRNLRMWLTNGICLLCSETSCCCHPGHPAHQRPEMCGPQWRVAERGPALSERPVCVSPQC